MTRGWSGRGTHRVLDLSTDVAGGFCTKLLAMQGAEVVRPAMWAAEEGPLATYLHAHKRLERGLGPLEVEDAFADAEVVVTSFDGGAASWGWGEAEVAAAFPGAVHLTTSPFGTTGPYREWRGGTLVDWAAGGYLYITGEPDRAPLAGPANLCGYVAGYTAAIAVLAALLRRRRTGTGTRLDISVMESMLAVHQSTFSRFGAGMVRTRTGRLTEVYPLVVQPCRDGFVSLGVVLDEEFDRLTIAMGRPELAADPRFATQQARWEHMETLDGLLVEWLSDLAADEVVALLQSHAVAAAKVATVEDLLANPQLAFRCFWDRAADGSRMPGNPLPVLPTTTVPPTVEPAGKRLAPPILPTSDGVPLPLAGPPPVVVLDLTAFWAGPSACRNLADLGARVIRVERPGSRVDFIEDREGAALAGRLFDAKMNRGKESVVLDLKTVEGRRLLLRLAEAADVLVENHRAGAMAALGLGPEDLARVNPRLVYVALSGFGATGPWASWRSYGPTIEAASSIESRTRYPGGPPLRLGHTLPDGVGGLAGTLAALAGLDRRVVTGAGSYFDVSQLETSAVLSGEELLGTSGDVGRAEVPRGRPCRSGTRADGGTRAGTVAGVFRCRGDDQWVAVSAARPEERCRLDRVLGLQLGDEAVGAEGDTSARLARYAAERTKEEVAGTLQRAGVPAFPAATAADLVGDPQLAERAFFVEVVLGDRVARLPGTPLHGRPVLARPQDRAPRFGEHTAAVVRELAGVDEAELGRLRAAGVVEAE